MKIIAVLSVVVMSCLAQRSPYAGIRPWGYPSIPINTASPTVVNAAAPANTAAVNSAAANANGLADRLGDDPASTVSTVPSVPTTTMRLPVEALGDAGLVERLSKLPVDHQPFWLINWQALEAHRSNPQSYAQRPNLFID